MPPPFEFLDLSEVTSFLVDEINKAVQATDIHNPPTITVSASSPDAVRRASGCQLTFYLFHVDQDPHHRNSPVTGPRAVPIPFQPLSLNLYYVLTAFAEANAVQEQQAMSIALRWLHEHPILHDVTFADGNRLTLTMQPESADELGRLWQSMTAAARLSAVYRVGVVFMISKQLGAGAKPVQSFNVVVDPASLPFAEDGEVIGTERRVTYAAPGATAPLTFVRSPAAVAPGQALHLWGSHLGIAPADHLYLLNADGSSETEVSAWIVPAADADGQGNRGSRLTVRLPATGSPAPGVYQFRVGSDGPPRFRSNTTPFSVAAAVDGPAPASSPILSAMTPGLFSVTGKGFDNAFTDVFLGTVPLTRRQPGDTLTSGDFLASGSTSLGFRAPAALPPGVYALRIRVHEIEADPAWWVQV